MLGFFENFPANIHRIGSFTSPLSSKKLQQRLIQVLHEINRETFSFEEVTHPTVPDCTIIFEAGLAEAKSFNYIDEEETKRVLSALRKEIFRSMDFFCAVRYYKGTGEKKTPLKFDYYLMRFVFGKNSVEIRVFHERGPRYISPEDIVAFLANEINKTSARTILKRVDPS
ncbi:MAG: hypothetical protein JSW44_02805 [Candidatus Bathyarchaeota archaeon]|nr:MAG: hypothetical protein JSW44_02805 [Candidatus Bathyarchaeota archaeon]